MGEKITKEFLLEQMERLELNYGKERFVVNQKMFNLWFEMFKDCKKEDVGYAIDRCIKESEFAPNIAGVMKFYREFEEEKKELENITLIQYKKILYVWGESFDLDTYKAIVNYIVKYPKEDRKKAIIELSQQAVSFAFNCDGQGRRDKPTIRAYIQGAR